jgi:hypothetical protein
MTHKGGNMTFKIQISAVAAAAFLISGAYAGDMADACVAALEADGRDTSGCTCLEDAVMADEALQEEFLALGEIADPAERYASASDAAKETMDKCTR